MAKIQVDFSSTEVRDPVPEGFHPVIVDVAEVRQKEGGSGYPYFHLDLKVTEGEAEGRHLFWKPSLSPKALWKLLPGLQALKVFPSNFDPKTDLWDFDYDEETGVILKPELVGLVAVADVVHEPYEGSTSSVVRDLVSIEEYYGETTAKSPVKTAAPTAATAPTAVVTSTGRKIRIG